MQRTISYGLAHYITEEEARRLAEVVEFIAEFFENGTSVSPSALYGDDDATEVGEEVIALRDAIFFDKRPA